MSTRTRLDDNLYVEGAAVHCVRCDAVVGRPDAWLAAALVKQTPVHDSAVVVPAAAGLFVDEEIVLRQAFCPGCLTALLTEVISTLDHAQRTKRVETASA